MTSNGENSRPETGPASPDWLDAPALLARADDDRGSFVTLEWADPGVSAEITKRPTCRKLAVLVQQQFTITISPDVDLPDDFILFLFIEPGVPANCDLSIPVQRIVCGPRPASTKAHPVLHTLVLSNPAHVTVEGDNWRIEPQPGFETPWVSLEVTNTEEELSISGSVPITSLDSHGDHEYNLDLQGDAPVVVRGGTASFRQRLQSVSVSGQGSVRALGAMHDSHVEIAGGLEVHHELVDSEIAIGGVLEVIGPVSLGQRSLRCGDARLVGTLTSVGEAHCKRLEIQGQVKQAGTITSETLDCHSSLTAKQVTANGDIKIQGNATCEQLTGGGSLEVRGALAGIKSLTWTPAGTGDRLEIQHPDTEIPLMSVERARSGGASPELHLWQGSEIQQLHVEIPELTIALVRSDASRERERRLTVGLHLRRNNTHLRLVQDTLRLRLAENTPRFSLEVPSEAVIEILECLGDIPRVSIRGDGEVNFADEATATRLRRVALTGRLRFSCPMNIDELTAAAWPIGTPEAAAQQENPAPRLNLSPGTVVEEASGLCRLENLNARIAGHHKRDFVVERVAAAGHNEGHLTNVNVNRLPEGQIPMLRNLRVLEVSGSSLRRLAGERTRLRSILMKPLRALRGTRRSETDDSPDDIDAAGSLTRDQIRARAETAAQLADILGGKVNSGASRAWLHWAVARLQHRGLNTWSIERPLRAAYRTMGYGFRPRPALQTWFAVALIGLGYAWLGGYAGEAPDIAFGWQWIERFIEILLLPIGYLRLGAADAGEVFKPVAVDLVGRILIGLPFLFVVLGTRQYFRSPVGQRQNAGND